MKIVNKKKFLKSISIACFILMMMVMFSNKTYSNANKKYKEEYIYNGDTLWEIAIKERENKKLQMENLPIEYRKNMTEFIV